MKNFSSSSLLLLATTLFSPTSYAWGSLGHQTVAYLAQHYVSNHTALWAQAILNDTSPSYLANIATWADSYRYTAEGSFSAVFHYIDALDSPPASCNVDYERDCGSDGCIVSAIANYTRRVQTAPDELDAVQRDYALRWIVHFVGDLSQPLHVENYEIGGNGIDVTFAGEQTNLHAAWDTSMPEELRGGKYGLVEAAAWADDLAFKIKNGTYSNVAASWLEGIDVHDPISTAMSWARDSNAYVCNVVLPNGGESYNNTELYPAYYETAVATVEQQIAKAGYRLAAWLNAIVETQTAGTYHRRAVGASRHTEVKRDLSGRDLLPKNLGLTVAQRARLEKKGDLGCGCTH